MVIAVFFNSSSNPWIGLCP